MQSFRLDSMSRLETCTADIEQPLRINTDWGYLQSLGSWTSAEKFNSQTAEVSFGVYPTLLCNVEGRLPQLSRSDGSHTLSYSRKLRAATGSCKS